MIERKGSFKTLARTQRGSVRFSRQKTEEKHWKYMKEKDPDHWDIEKPGINGIQAAEMCDKGG